MSLKPNEMFPKLRAVHDAGEVQGRPVTNQIAQEFRITLKGNETSWRLKELAIALGEPGLERFLNKASGKVPKGQRAHFKIQILNQEVYGAGKLRQSLILNRSTRLAYRDPML